MQTQAFPRKSVGRVVPWILCIAAVISLFLLLPRADAVTKSEINALKSKQSQLQSDKSTLQSKISSIQDDKSKAVTQKTLLEQEIEVTRQQLDVANDLIAQYDQQITEKEAELEAAQEKEQQYYELFCERVRSMEEDGTENYWAVLFNSTDFSDFLDRLDVISEVMDYDSGIMDQLKEARQEVETAKADLESSRAEQQEVKAQLESYQADLNTKKAQVNTLIAQIKAAEDEYASQLAAIDDESVDLSSQIAAAEQQYAAQIAAQKAAQGSDSSSSSTSGFIWPTPGYYTVTSSYGWRNHPITGKRSFHGGIDIGAPGGTQILASKSGTVVISTYNSSYGNYVVIAHYDGTKTLYAHMSKRAVSAGDTVSQSQVIGYVGSTGSSTGNHLHFEIWTGSSSSSRVNPMNYF